MKKIYSLLLLSCFMLLGAQSVWATDYYIADDSSLSGESWSSSATKMDESDGLYSYTFENVAAGKHLFKFVTGSTWIGYNHASYTYKNEESDLNLSGEASMGEDNFAFTTAATANVTIYFKPSDDLVYVSVPTYSLNIDMKTTATDPHLYAYNDPNKYNGDWPGTKTTRSTISGGYRFTIKAPQGWPLSLVFTNGNTGSLQKTNDIFVGTISAAATYTYTVNSSYQATGLKGNWDSWILHQFDNDIAIVSIASTNTYEFGVENLNTWYSYNPNDYTFTSSNRSHQFYTGNANAKINASVTGDYVFSWVGTTLSVVYPSQSYSRTMDEDAWGTICLPYAVTAANVTAANMDFYSILGVDNKTTPTKLYLKAEDELEAGKPYIFQATAANPSVNYGSSAELAGNANGLYGTYLATTIDGRTDDDNKLYVITSAGKVQQADATCNVGANKAYIKWNEVDPYNPGSGAPGVRFIEMPMGPSNATNINAIDASEEAVKFFENGKLYIKKNGVVYDMMGAIVK